MAGLAYLRPGNCGYQRRHGEVPDCFSQGNGLVHLRRDSGRYNWERFLGDCAGGLIAALIALPYGLSMAALMHLPPILGVVTSILTAPITALLGRNPVLIGGTASATVPFIAAAVRSQGIGGAAKVSIVASVWMMVFCVLR